MAKEVVTRGVKIVYTGDDFAGETGPADVPAHFRELFFPGSAGSCRGYKALGLYVIKHTDGMIWPLIDMIVDSGHRLPGSHRPDRRHGPRRGEDADTEAASR